jgi:transcriptional regulator with XRE-family HTH domain
MNAINARSFFMKLEIWRKKRNLSYPQLAEKLGASHATVVRRWCLPNDHKDRMIPSPKFMAIIQESTLGEVTANDFYR